MFGVFQIYFIIMSMNYLYGRFLKNNKMTYWMTAMFKTVCKAF